MFMKMNCNIAIITPSNIHKFLIIFCILNVFACHLKIPK